MAFEKVLGSVSDWTTYLVKQHWKLLILQPVGSVDSRFKTSTIYYSNFPKRAEYTKNLHSTKISLGHFRLGWGSLEWVLGMKRFNFLILVAVFAV